MPDVSTCLWYDGEAEEAARCYVGLVPGSAMGRVMRPAPGASALVVEFALAGVPYVGLNGGPEFRHSPAASITVMTPDQAGSDDVWHAHLRAGSTEGPCGWMTDRWGVSWQIYPRVMQELLFGPDPEANARAMACMRGQSRIDTAAIMAAAKGD